MKYGPEFEAFWKDMLHRPDSYPKREAYAYWTAAKPLKDGSRITSGEWLEIHEGAKAYRELYQGEPQYIMNAAKWIFNGHWEGWLEKKRQQEAARSHWTDEERKKARVAEFNRRYQARRIEEHQRGNTSYSIEDFKAELRPNLRVVGE